MAGQRELGGISSRGSPETWSKLCTDPNHQSTTGGSMTLNDRQVEMCESSQWDFSDLTALFLNCTLKRTPEVSHTEGLIRIAKAILEKNKVSVDVLRPVDHNLAHGVYPDMREQGWDADDWPQIYEKVKSAEILVSHHPYGWERNRPCVPKSSKGCIRLPDISTNKVNTLTMVVWRAVSSPATKTAPNTAR